MILFSIFLWSLVSGHPGVAFLLILRLLARWAAERLFTTSSPSLV